MFNVRLPLNFNSPYKATSIIEFWRCWHTLSRFLRDYLYIPLGGSRLGADVVMGRIWLSPCCWAVFGMAQRGTLCFGGCITASCWWATACLSQRLSAFRSKFLDRAARPIRPLDRYRNDFQPGVHGP